MKTWTVISLIVLMYLCSGCHRLVDTVRSKISWILATDNSRHGRTQVVVPFSIRGVVKDFQGDSSIVEVGGIQIADFPFFVEYCQYTGDKNRVIKAVNNIPVDTGSLSAGDKCLPATRKQLDAVIGSKEKDVYHSQLFWHFEDLKSYDIYTCIRMPLRHFIIFDRNSDTVYHRIEELRE